MGGRRGQDVGVELVRVRVEVRQEVGLEFSYRVYGQWGYQIVDVVKLYFIF